MVKTWDACLLFLRLDIYLLGYGMLGWYDISSAPFCHMASQLVLWILHRQTSIFIYTVTPYRLLCQIQTLSSTVSSTVVYYLTFREKVTHLWPISQSVQYSVQQSTLSQLHLSFAFRRLNYKYVLQQYRVYLKLRGDSSHLVRAVSVPYLNEASQTHWTRLDWTFVLCVCMDSGNICYLSICIASTIR